MASNQCLYLGFCVLLCSGLCTCHRDLMNDSNDHVIKPMETDDLIAKPTVTDEVTSWQYKDIPKDGARDDDVVENFGGVGSGTGIGYGSGDGVGTGYGQGSGFGSGSGIFGGPGGYGEGQGEGFGSGYGEGRGYGSGSGRGCTPGYNCPVTSTPCPHCGYPVAMPPPGQGCGTCPGEGDSMDQKAMHVSHELNMEMNSANEQVN